MPERESGDKYYYSKGFTRLLAKMDEDSRRTIKTLAIVAEKPIMKIVEEALVDFIGNPEQYENDFQSSRNGSLKTFVPKDLHRRVKILAARDFGRRLGDLSGFVIATWAKKKLDEAQYSA